MADEPLNLDGHAEYAGLWWLPGEPDERIAGTLRYEAETGLVLSLIGAFEDRIMSSPSPGLVMLHEGTQTWDVIHGVAEQREITLLGCIPTGTTRTLGARVKSPDRQTVKAAMALIGAHVSGEDEAVFSAAEVSVEDLGLWADSSVFEGTMGLPGGRPDGSGTISMAPVDAQSVLVDGTEFSLTHRLTLPSFDQRKGGTVARMRDTTFLRVVPADRYSLHDALRAAGLVQDLVALAMHRAAGVVWLRLELADADTVPRGDGPVQRRCAEVLYAPSMVGKHDAKAVHHHRVFFACAQLPFEEVWPRWCEAHDRLQAAINMMMGLRYAPARYIENNLLTAVGAAEALHRGLGIGEPPVPADEFRTMRSAMLAQVPEEYRERFRAAIRNDPTLRDRLSALAARPDQAAISSLIPDADRWARRTTRARNDLAHEGRTPDHSFEELIAVVEVTTAVCILNILHELGLPAEHQRDLVRENPQLRMTATKAHEWLATQEAGS